MKYWRHLLHMSNSRYPKSCYLMLKSHTEIDRINWASNVRDLLFRYGFGFVWISQDVGDVPALSKLFRQRLIDCCIQDWHKQVTASSKCEYYQHFKTMLNVERYL